MISRFSRGENRARSLAPVQWRRASVGNCPPLRRASREGARQEPPLGALAQQPQLAQREWKGADGEAVLGCRPPGQQRDEAVREHESRRATTSAPTPIMRKSRDDSCAGDAACRLFSHSASTSVGRFTSARAIATRCFWPTHSRWGRASWRISTPSAFNIERDAARSTGSPAMLCATRMGRTDEQDVVPCAKFESIQSQDLGAAGVAEAKIFDANHRAARRSLVPNPDRHPKVRRERPMIGGAKEKGLRRRKPLVPRRQGATPNGGSDRRQLAVAQVEDPLLAGGRFTIHLGGRIPAGVESLRGVIVGGRIRLARLVGRRRDRFFHRDAP